MFRKVEFFFLVLYIFISVVYIVCTPPFCRGEVEAPNKFSKQGGGRLDRTLTFRGGLLEKRGVTFFRGVAIVT